MKNRTLVAVALASTLAVGAFAHGGTQDNDGAYGQSMMGGQQSMMGGQGIQNRGSMNGQYMQKRGSMNRRGGGMMGGGMMGGGMQMFSQLNLNKEQKFQLSILRDEMRIGMKKLMHNNQQMGQIGKFIKGDSFDKKAFKKYMNQKHEKMLSLMSTNMEKAFKILTKEQITELKKNFADK